MRERRMDFFCWVFPLLGRGATAAVLVCVSVYVVFMGIGAAHAGNRRMYTIKQSWLWMHTQHSAITSLATCDLGLGNCFCILLGLSLFFF